MASAAGFSIVELLVAMGITLSILASVLTLVRGVQLGFTRESERADMQQRLRVAGDAIHQDLMMAGAGVSQGPRKGSLAFSLPSVLPFRQGAQGADPAGTFKIGTITLTFVPRVSSAQTVIRGPILAQSGLVPIGAGAGCPPGDPACGFGVGMNVMVFDRTGSFDTFTVTNVQGDWLDLRHDMVDTGVVYPAGSTIAEVRSRTYYLQWDAASGGSRLMRYDGSGSDAAVADHVVGLSFAYFGDADPPVLTKPITDEIGPWTTYGPEPPQVDVQSTLYPPGENCVFQLDSSGLVPIPRLPALGGGVSAALVELTAGQLTDGPWCPDAASPQRWDADLLRIRRIDVTVRVESALSAFRGPAGLLFSRAGTSRDGERWLPDREVRFSVAPRNLNGGW